jgi:hypothetical protein
MVRWAHSSCAPNNIILDYFFQQVYIQNIKQMTGSLQSCTMRQKTFAWVAGLVLYGGLSAGTN